MGKFRDILNEANNNGRMLKKLHDLDDKIEDFVDDLEKKINNVEDNPVFVKKAHQLLADMSKEYSEFIMALRAVVNAVDRKSQMLPSFDKFESKVRDVRSNMNTDEPEPEPEPVPEPEPKKSPVKEALEK